MEKPWFLKAKWYFSGLVAVVLLISFVLTSPLFFVVLASIVSAWAVFIIFSAIFSVGESNGMSIRKIEEARAIYEKYLREINIPKEKHLLDQLAISNEAVLAHCLQMTEEMKELIAQGRREKAMRWLCFIQGCLFTLRHYTIETLKNHNRPDNIK